MIDVAMLRRLTSEVSERDDLDALCRELDVDPAVISEAVMGMGFGQSQEVVGTIAIALLVGIKAGREGGDG